MTASQRLVLQKWTLGDVVEDEVLCNLFRVRIDLLVFMLQMVHVTDVHEL